MYGLVLLCILIERLVVTGIHSNFAGEKEHQQLVNFGHVAQVAFRNHPLHLLSEKSLDLIEYLSTIANSTDCQAKPVFMSMGRVQDPLYWKLIEGFFHSMFYFDHLSCSVMICVTGIVASVLYSGCPTNVSIGEITMCLV